MFQKFYFMNFFEILSSKSSKSQNLNQLFFKSSVFHISRILLKTLTWVPCATWGMQGWFLGAARRKIGGTKKNVFLGLKKKIGQFCNGNDKLNPLFFFYAGAKLGLKRVTLLNFHRVGFLFFLVHGLTISDLNACVKLKVKTDPSFMWPYSPCLWS